MKNLEMIVDTLEQQQIGDGCEWNSSNDYWIGKDDDNQILAIYGIPARVENLSQNGESLENIGYVREEAYNMIKKCILSKGASCYIDVDEGEIHYHRFVVHSDKISDDEYCVNVTCIDDTETQLQIDDIKFEKSKKYKEHLRHKIEDLGDDQYKLRLLNNGEYKFKITGSVSGNKLKCYLTCQKS